MKSRPLPPSLKTEVILGFPSETEEDFRDTLDLCVSCKGCRRECPTGIDMAKIKIEFLHHYRKRHGLILRDRLIAYLPRYAPLASRLAPLVNAIQSPGRIALGFARDRTLPKWRRDAFHEERTGEPPDGHRRAQPLVHFPHTVQSQRNGVGMLATDVLQPLRERAHAQDG